MGTCKGPNCGEEILWVSSRKGKPVCLDPEPNPAGNVVLEPGDGDGPVAVVLANDEAGRYTGDKYMPHWKTCPDRDSFRKPKKGQATLAFLLASLFLVTGCATVGTSTESFEWWTRKYEVRMGLEERTKIYFGETPLDSCGYVGYETEIGRYGPELVLVTMFDPNKEGCDPPWEIAKHEACHRRMQHHRLYRLDDTGWLSPGFGGDLIEPEAEAEKCEGWYE
jgi:hypothetical protein